jgi:hypothetical protein
VIAQLPGLARTVLGWVVGQEEITLIELMGRQVIRAVAEF